MNCELGDQWMIQGLPVLNHLSAHQPFGGVSHFFWVNDKFNFFIFSAPTVSVVDPDPDRIQIQWGPWIRIREGKNGPEKYRTIKINFIFWRAEGFSCNLDVVYGGLGISKLPQFLIKKINKYIVSCDGAVVRLPPLWFWTVDLQITKKMWIFH